VVEVKARSNRSAPGLHVRALYALQNRIFALPAHLDQEGSRMTVVACANDEPLRLVGAYEIRDLLGVSRQRVYQLTGRADFPEPVAHLTQGKVWTLDDIEAWIKEHRAG
jgi:predicted DNA-binding transcriptional regulator AlpA